MSQVFEHNAATSHAEVLEHEEAVYAKRIVEVPSNMQFRADYDGQTDGLPKYTGYAAKGLGEGTTGWLLKEFTYDANRQCTKILIAYGTWTARATASYS